jgi:hypothetical protein
MTRELKPVPQIYSAKQVADAKARVEEVRAELHAAGHAEGKAHGLKLAGRYRDGAVAAAGFIIGCVVSAVFLVSMYERAAINSSIVADRVLARTLNRSLDDGLSPDNSITVRDARGELRDPRTDCTALPGRRCAAAPADAPRTRN